MLTGMSDTEKTNLIMGLLGFEVYDDLYAATFEKLNRFGDEAEQWKKELETLDYKEQSAEALIQEKQGYLDRVNSKGRTLGEDIDEYDRKIKELKKELDNVKAVNVEGDEKKFEDELAQLKELKKEMSKEEEMIRIEQENYRNDKMRRKDDASTTRYELKRRGERRQDAETRIKELRELKPGTKCDKCGNSITKGNVDAFVDEQEELIKDLVSSTEILEKAVADVDKLIEFLDEKLQELSERLSKIKTKSATFEEEIEVVEAELDRTRKQKTVHLLAAEEVKGEIASLEAQSNEKHRQVKEYLKESEEVSKAIVDKKREIALIDGLRDEVKWKIDKNEKGVEVLEFWKMSFSPKGIRALLLDRFCNEFNRTVNEYLATVSGGSMSIVISPTKALKSGEERNKIGMTINLGKQEVIYESLSGGEKRRVDVSLCLALNKWVSSKYGLEHGLLGILILDELFAYLDRSGEESIGTALYEEGKDKAVFVISHTAELGSYAERVWTVVKKEGVSDLVMDKGGYRG